MRGGSVAPSKLAFLTFPDRNWCTMAWCLCESGWVMFRALQEIEADAVVLAVGISGLQKIVSGSPALAARAEFRAVANLGSLDVLAGLLGSFLSDV